MVGVWRHGRRSAGAWKMVRHGRRLRYVRRLGHGGKARTCWKARQWQKGGVC